jgi:hypothetical protein
MAEQTGFEYAGTVRTISPHLSCMHFRAVIHSTRLGIHLARSAVGARLEYERVTRTYLSR